MFPSHTHMTQGFQKRRAHLAVFLIAGLTLALALADNLTQDTASAQVMRPVLISEADSTRAVALESVARVREPFSINSRVAFGGDGRTRLMLFALYLSGGDASAVTADAQDGSGRIYTLTVEHVGPVPRQEWMTSVIVRLHDEMVEGGDVLVRVTHRGVSSNRVRVGIGRIGGGPPDDLGSAPTPAPAFPAPTPNTNPVTAGNLTVSDVQTIIAQAVSAAAALGRSVTVAVTDREGNVLGLFSMTGATSQTQFRGGGPGPDLTPHPISGLVPRGLAGTNLPPVLTPVPRAAISKAGTAAFFSTQGNAFTPRTASFIIQEHFPPGVNFRPGGPLYGVQFSQLPCSDIKIPGLPFGLSGDPGAVPLYKNGLPAGAVGIEGDGTYTVDRDPVDFDRPFEEVIAVAAGRGYEPPGLIRGDNILVDGVRLPFVNVSDADAPRPPTIPFGLLPGLLDPFFPLRGAQPSAFVPTAVGGVGGAADLRFFPFVGSTSASANRLTASDVTTIIGQAARQAVITRAAIRQPLGSHAQVSITVVDADGQVLGIFRTADAPVFGFDVSAQKARSAAFFSRADAGALLRAVGMGSYVDRAAADGLGLNGAVAFSERAIGFLHRPFFPDGIEGTPAGPLSTEISEWNVFNLGLQVDLITTNLVASLVGANVRCTSLPQLPNGLQIFAGAVPLYRGGELIGAIGISGDGIDQDDIIAAAGANGYAPPAAMRSDQFFVRGSRLPFLKFPRSPNL